MATTPNDLTRQQLDELDSLLQRMLAVPAAKAEPAKPPLPIVPLPEPPSGWRPDAPSPASPPHLTAQPAMALAAMPPKSLNSLESPQPFAPSPLLTLERPSPAKYVAPAEKPVDLGKLDLAELTPLPLPAAMPMATSKPVKSRSLSPLLWPLFAVNWLLEGSLKLFGPPGEMLTSRPGKNMLAMAGILMIIGASLWTAHGHGWISLPLEKLPR